MTLIELIISVVIITLLIGSAAAAFGAGIGQVKENDTTLAESHDVQLVQTYLPTDIQSVQDSTAAGGNSDVVTTFDAAAGYCNNAGTNLIKMKWFDGSTTYRVDYRIQQDGTTWSLVRYACNSASAETKKLVVGHQLLAPTDAKWSSGGATLCATRVEVTVLLASGYSFKVAANRRTPTASPAVCKNFTMEVTPATKDVKAGSSVTFDVKITPSGNFTGPVTLSTSDLPSGATAMFSPVSFASGETTMKTSTMTITTTASTPTGNAAFTVLGTAGSLTRSAGASLEVLDPTSPKILQVEMFDGRTGTPNGKIDELIALFDSPLVKACTTKSDWTLVLPPMNTTISTITKTDPTHLSIKLNEGAVVDTAATSFKVIYLPSAATCEADPIASPGLDVVDRAGPIPTGIGTTGGNATPASGDKIEITFSENIANCAPTSTTVKLVNDASNPKGRTFLELPNVIQGSVDIGTGYITKKSEGASWANSSVTCLGSKLSVTVGSNCVSTANGCADLGAGSGSFSFLPVAGLLRDAEVPVSNAMVSTVAATGGPIF